MGKLLILIPAFNEEQAISPLLRRLQSQILSLNNSAVQQIDIIVINDGSQDQTSSLARAEGVKVLDLCFNLGIGGAVQLGYQYAFNHDYQYCVQIDGDGQHNPDDIQKLFTTLIETGSDLCIGSRFLEKSSGDRSTWMRRLGKTLISWTISLFHQKKITDPTSGLRLGNRKVIEQFARVYPHDYPEPESLAALLRQGYHVCEAPVAMSPRHHGKSSINFWKSIHYMVKILSAIALDSLRPHS